MPMVLLFHVVISYAVSGTCIFKFVLFSIVLFSIDKEFSPVSFPFAGWTLRVARRFVRVGGRRSCVRRGVSALWRGKTEDHKVGQHQPGLHEGRAVLGERRGRIVAVGRRIGNLQSSGVPVETVYDRPGHPEVGQRLGISPGRRSNEEIDRSRGGSESSEQQRRGCGETAEGSTRFHRLIPGGSSVVRPATCAKDFPIDLPPPRGN